MAAYVLSDRNRVTLFEADTRLGGHAHTHVVDRGDGTVVAVDSAFLVHNDRTYPTLCRLFSELGIETHETDMSMSVRDGATGLEYAGARGIGGLFPSWGNLARPRYLRMLGEVKRFHREATLLLDSDSAADDGDETLGVVRRAAELLAVLRRTLHDPIGGRGLVMCAGRCHALPGPLPLRLPATPRHAVGVRVADVADRRRRVCHLRRSDRTAHSRGVTRRTGAFGAAGARRRADLRRGRGAPPVRRRRHRHPPESGPAHARRAEPRPARGPRRDRLFHQPHPAAHRRVGTSATARAREPPGTTWRPRTPTTSWSPTTSPA